MLDTPILTEPLDSQRFCDVSTPMMFLWQPVANAARYELEVEVKFPYIDQWSRYYWISISSGLTSYTSPRFCGNYPGRWRLTAYSASDSSQPSPWSYFEFFPPESNKYVAIPVSPVNGTFFYPSTPVIALKWARLYDDHHYWKPTGYCIEIDILRKHFRIKPPLILRSIKTAAMSRKKIKQQRRMPPMNVSNFIYYTWEKYAGYEIGGADQTTLDLQTSTLKYGIYRWRVLMTGKPHLECPPAYSEYAAFQYGFFRL